MICIRNCDGTPYRLSGSMQVFDPENPELNLLNQWDAELIAFSGTPIFYFECFLQINTIDKLYQEDRGKIFATNPVQLYGYYDPITASNFMNVFGMDGPEELKITFNYRAVLKALGKPPKIGSRLFTPHKRENWVIVSRGVSEFQLWGEFHLILFCQRFQESTTDGSGQQTSKQVDFKLNSGPLFDS